MLFGGITLPGAPDPQNIARLDVLPIPQIRRMMRVGVAIDREHLWQLSSQLESKKAGLKNLISTYIPPEALDQFVGESPNDLDLNVDSAEQIAHLLYKLLGVGRGQRLKLTKSGKRLSTGKKQLEGLKRDHEVVSLILEYRECSKLKSTYTDKLPLIARPHPAGPDCPLCGLSHVELSWRVHTSILTTRTATGRLASKNPNLQNIPTRTKAGQDVRRGFVASKGKLLISADYSQIELRLLAHAANERNMMKVFENGGDIHLATAMRAFNIEDPKKVDKILHRAPCKNVNFGVAYGLGPPGLYDLMAVTYATAGQDLPDWLDQEWCTGFIKLWFELYPEAQEYFELQHYRAKRYGIVWTMFGRVRRVPEVQSVHERIRVAGLRQAGNMPIQGDSADVMKIGMARVERRLEGLRGQGIYVEAMLPIHDELLVEADEEWAEEIAEIVKFEMEQALVDDKGVLQCRVPIKSDSRVMKVWEKE